MVGGDFGGGVADSGAGEFVRQFRGALLGDLGGAVENLAAEVRAGFRPAGLRLARGHRGVAEILARSEAIVGELRAAIEGLRGGDAAAFAARKFSADEELVGFENVEAGHGGKE